MKVIGVTGGIGAGKSTVIKIARENFPVAVIYTDDVAKEQMKKGGCSYFDVVKEFGEGILDEEGEIDRSKLAEIVFSDDFKVQKINQITHPNVKRYTLSKIEEYRQSGIYQAVLVETALLFEAKFDQFCDITLFIDASEEVRRKRLIYSRNYTEEKIDAILEKQRNVSYAKQHCSFLIRNDENTRMEDIVEKLKMII